MPYQGSRLVDCNRKIDKFGESPRPCPLVLTVDIGRGQSRWFRGEDSFNLIEAYLHFGVALSRNLGYPPKTRR